MVNNCANPQCAKPLHYLREGRIFVFDMQNRSVNPADEKQGHQLEHFWLCGPCSQKFQVTFEAGKGIVLVPRRLGRMPVAGTSVTALAS